ncbi:hypothetical protein [Sphingobium sp. EM0848]|uniref:hypothetical protein n=1 Tax=Sphingobium sp. EM0848 TaxID=2743473 RepID=UPI001C3F6E2C|nr:hypothetical protein [Sphingobium sp. EM0848]
MSSITLTPNAYRNHLYHEVQAAIGGRYLYVSMKGFFTGRQTVCIRPSPIAYTHP